MDIQYLNDLYNWISSNDESYKNKYTFEQFKQNMQNSDYAIKMHNWISSKDDTFSTRRPLENFISLVSNKVLSQAPSIEMTQGTAGEQTPTYLTQGNEQQDDNIASQLLKKKVGTTASPLEEPSSDLLSAPSKSFNQPRIIAGTPLIGQPKKSSTPTYQQQKAISQMTTLQPVVADQTFMAAPKQPKGILEQDELQDVNKSFLAKQLRSITPDLIGKEEEYVVPQLNYQFGDLGFKFEEAGATGDWMNVTAPNGKKIQISLDPFTSGKEASESIALKKFMLDNIKAIPNLKDYEKFYTGENKKFINEKELNEATEKNSTAANDLKKQIDDFVLMKKKTEEQEASLNLIPINERNSEEYKNLLNQVEKSKDNLLKNQLDLSKKYNEGLKKEDNLKIQIGKYTDMQSDQGTWYDELFHSSLKGIGRAINNIWNMSVDAIVEGPAAASEGMSDEKIKQVKEAYTNPEIRNLPSNIVSLFSDTKPTKEYSQDFGKGFWGGALQGVAESLPAMLTGEASLPMFFMQAEDGAIEQMDNDPNFKGVSDSEKKMVAIPMAIVGSVLEEFGLRNTIANKGVFNKLIMRGIGEAGSEITAKSFGELVKNDIKSGLLRGTLTIAGGALAEAETGGMQEVSDISIKQIYNALKGKKMFDTPESVKDYVLQVATASAQEAVGGFIMGMPHAVAAANTKQGFKGMDDATFKTFEQFANDVNVQSAFVSSLKSQIVSGKISKEEADKTLQSYRDAAGLFNSLPSDLNIEDKKEAMNLLKERKAIENSIQNKDAALVTKQQKRINEINQSLNKLSENAVQEPTTNESVLRAEQPQVGLQEMVQGNQPTGVAEAVTQAEQVISPETKTEEVTATPISTTAQAMIGSPSGEVKFRLAEGTEDKVKNSEEITAEMNNMPAAQVEFTEPEVSQKGLKVNPVAESNSIVKVAKKIGNALLKPIQAFNGIPMLQGMSDMLAAGKIKDSMGNDMDVEGGLLFNVLGKNKDAAWAGVTEEGAKGQYDNAVKLYESNKELFDRLWKEGKLPDGHVPMAIMRMADSAVHSNEATLRWLLPTVESLPMNNRENAMNSFVESMKGSLNTKNDAAKAQTILDFIQEKNITTLDGLFKEVIADANLRAKGDKSSKLNLDDRSLIYESIVSQPGVKKATNPIVKSLLEGTDGSKNKTFTSDVVYNAIGEPSMLKTKQGEVVSVVGINVKDGGVVPVEHGNYGFGPKGQVIALIENPMHGTEVFPEWKAKSSRVFKENVKGELPTPEKVASQTGGTFFNDKAFRGAKVLAGVIDDLNLLIGKLRFAFPSVSVSTTQEEFDNIVSSPEVRTSISDGKIILGITKDGKIYLNPEASSLKTPIHEFGHVWIDFLRSDASGKKGTDLLNQGLKLVENTDAHKKAIEKYGNTPIALEEALVELMADKGASIIDSAKKSQFKSWLNAVFKYIKDKFTTFKDLDRNKIANMSLEDFINTGLADLFSGREVSAEFVPSQAEASTRARFELQDNAEYQQMKGVIEDYIGTAENKRISRADIISNAIDMLSNSKAYENADDIQREQMVRDINKVLGVRQKSAPRADRLLNGVQDVTKITMTEKASLVKQIKDMARGAKDAIRAAKIASIELGKSIKELVTAGKISNKQMANVINRFAKTNVLNEESVAKFVDYMSNVFADSEYADKIANVRKKLGTAKKNVVTKLGNAQNLIPALQKMLSISPTLIPESQFEAYQGLVDMLGERKAVLELQDINDVTKTTNDILDAINEQESLADELAERFDSYENKAIDENGKLEFGETIKNMIADGTITEADADVMRKYKSSIVEAVTNEGMTEQEIADEKEELIQGLNETNVDTERLTTKDEVKSARNLVKLLRQVNLESLTNAQLKTLSKIVDNINNGYLPHSAQLMTERLNSVINSDILAESIENAKPLKLSAAYAKIKSLFMKNGKQFNEMLRRGPSYFIDEMFGNFKSKNIFKSLFEKAAQAESAFQSESHRISKILAKAQDKVAASFKNNPNKVLMSHFKMMTYLIQREYDSNPGNKQVNQAADYIRETIKKTKKGETKYGDREIEMLQDILNNYTDNEGNIDRAKLAESFNKAEINALNTIREVNDGLTETAMHTAAVIRGEKLNPLNNYVHLSVMPDYNPDADISSVASVVNYNNSLNPSTKAKTLIERTGTVKPLDFDVFSSVQNGARQTLMDYHLTEPIRTARKTLNETEKRLEENPSTTKQQWNIFNAIKNSFEETTSNLLMNSSLSSTIADEVVNEISKQGYRAILGSVPRFISELSSNIGFAVANPKAFINGLKYTNFTMTGNGVDVMNNVGSKQTNRLFHGDTLSGRVVDTSLLSQATGVKGGLAKNPIANALHIIHNNSTKKVKNVIELIADALISTPDKVLNRPMWFGTFANEFKKITGEDVDFDKIAANDDAYMQEFENVIEKAKDVADEMSVYSGASDNAYMGILKGANRPNQTVLKRVFNNFNNFMTRFSIYEYSAARQGIYAAMGDGSLSRQQGVALLAGVTARMTTYTLLSTMLGNAMLGAFGGGDDEEDKDEKSMLQSFGQALTSSATSLLFGRDFGNATKTLVNYGLEKVNEKFLGALRNGEYDPYKDAIAYSMIPKEKKGKQTTLSDFILQMGGPFGPALKTAELAVKKATEEPKKKESAIQRQKDELMIRLPLEVLGNLGWVPLYKDVRKIAIDKIYASLDKEQKEEALNQERTRIEKETKNQEDINAMDMLRQQETDPDVLYEINKKQNRLNETEQEKEVRIQNDKEDKAIEKSLLDNYDNQSDMKKYAPDLYKERFGEGSDWYESHKNEDYVNKRLREIKTGIEEKEFGYTPRKKGGKEKFGSIGKEGWQSGDDLWKSFNKKGKNNSKKKFAIIGNQ